VVHTLVGLICQTFAKVWWHERGWGSAEED